MNTDNTRGPVIMGIDGSLAERYAIRWAARATAMRHAMLRLVHVHRERFDTAAPDRMDEVKKIALEVEPALQVDIAVTDGNVNETLLRESEKARLLVLSSHGRARPLEGLWQSTAVTLASAAPCPVVTVPRGPSRLEVVHGPVVVGVDGTPVSEPALAFAFDHASLSGAELVAVHSWSDSAVDADSSAREGLSWERVAEAEEEILAERLAGWQEKYPEVRVRRVVAHDRAAHSLLTRARTAQLLVVGFGGHGGLAGLLHGSTSQALLYETPCPLAIVRADGV